MPSARSAKPRPPKTPASPGLFPDLEAPDQSSAKNPAGRKARPTRRPGGYEVGRLLIADLLHVHSQAPGPPLTESEKAALVSALSSAQDIAQYAEMRNVHDYLVRASLMSQLYRQSAELESRRMTEALARLRWAELENLNLCRRPRIMTPGQYRELGPKPSEAVAVLQNAPASAEYLDERGWYREPDSELAPFAAEAFVGQMRSWLGLYGNYRHYRRELAVIRAAVKLLGEFIGVEGVERLIAGPKEEEAAELNQLMAEVPPLVVRRGRRPGERPEAELREELSLLLTPLEPWDLEPAPENVERARGEINFNLAQGGEQAVYDILRGTDGVR